MIISAKLKRGINTLVGLSGISAFLYCVYYRQTSRRREVILSAPHFDGDEESHPLKKRNRSFAGKANAGPSQDDKPLIPNYEQNARLGVVIW